MRRDLGHFIAFSALLIFGLAAPAVEGAPSPDLGKPLGTLWYPGPYEPPAPGKAPETAPAPAFSAPAPAPDSPPRAKVPEPPPIGTPQPAKPLGTLWYPGAYDPKAAAAAPLPAPIIEPAPPPAPRRESRKPLGTLWYPGTYDPKGPAGGAPIPVQEQTPGAAKQQGITEAPQRASPPQPAAGARSVPAGGPATPAPGPKVSSPGSPVPPVHLSADEMSFDQERNLITARGNVEVVHGDRKLVADIITYDQRTDIVYASGNVELTEPGGERIFGDRMEISGDLKDAIVESIGIILTDRSRIAAAGARRSDATITEMRKGVYSPCNLCQDEPEKPPLWQLKAVKIIHDKNSKTIEYRDAWLEVMGVPVAYTPYFLHPDPTVKRQSGFLAPSFGGSSDLGFVAQVPYFFNIAPNQDATVTALATGNEGSGAIGEYRHRFLSGSLDATASMVLGDTEDDFRGHIDAEGRFDINDTWRLGFDFNRATDDTYLRRYGFSAGNSLDSRLFAERFRKRNYLAVNAYAFQRLREEDDAGLEPLILPMIDFNHIGQPDRFGGQTVLDVNLLSLTRDEGADTRRLSIRPGWQLPFLGPLGDAYKLSLSVLGNFYLVDELARTGKSNFSGFSKRLVPQVLLDWRMPFVKEGRDVSQVIEPIAVAIYSPNAGNPDEIPNEDSQELEFDDTNLFSPNKFSGIDRIEDGPRINYGVKWGVYGKKGGSASFFIGQTWRPRSSKTFVTGSGLEEDFSDIVGRASISPLEGLNLLYRTRFASDNFTWKRNEVAFSAGAPSLNVSANYVFIERQQDSEFAGREELNMSASSQLNRFWRVRVSGLRDIASDEMRSLNASLVYENECVIFTTRASRTFFRDRDLEPTDQLTFNVVLKTLGEVRTGFSRSQ